MGKKHHTEMMRGDTKWCSQCQSYVPLDNFHKDSSNKYGLAYWCKPCAITSSRKNHKRRIKEESAYKEAKRNAYFKLKYGMTLEQRTDLLGKQNNACAICGVKLSESGTHTHVDHCHTTGKVRAILCTNCNRGLGHFQDNPELLLKAADYINQHSVSEDGTKEVLQ